jgi:hypothetical protein
LVGDDVPLLKVKRKRVPVLTPGKLAKRPEGA